jgi:hypothetical protein
VFLGEKKKASMFEFEFNDSVVLRQQEVLEAALSTNPKTQKALQKLINKVLTEVRPDVVSRIRNSLNTDPREAARSVRRITYRQILGGDLNIRNKKRKAGQPNTYEPPRKLQPHQRGGNRVPRSQRTNQVMHYGPSDRGWILRIVNSGTAERMAGTRNGRLHGNRGAIAPRNFFRSAAEPALMRAVDNLAALIDSELTKMLNTKN